MIEDLEFRKQRDHTEYCQHKYTDNGPNQHNITSNGRESVGLESVWGRFGRMMTGKNKDIFSTTFTNYPHMAHKSETGVGAWTSNQSHIKLNKIKFGCAI